MDPLGVECPSWAVHRGDCAEELLPFRASPSSPAQWLRYGVCAEYVLCWATCVVGHQGAFPHSVAGPCSVRELLNDLDVSCDAEFVSTGAADIGGFAIDYISRSGRICV